MKAGVLATSDPAAGDPVKAIGWGKSGSDMEAFKTLHEVDLNTHETVMPKVNNVNIFDHKKYTVWGGRLLKRFCSMLMI